MSYCRDARRAWPLVLPALLGGCASLIGPREVDLPLARLQQSLDRRFPVNQRVLSLADLQLSRPRLTLLPERDRVALTVDASLNAPLLARALHGELSLSGHLAINAGRSAVIVTGVKVEQIAIDGLDGEIRRQFAGVANLLSQSILQEGELYKLRPEQLRYAGVQFVPTGIVVSSGGLVMTLVPAP